MIVRDNCSWATHAKTGVLIYCPHPGAKWWFPSPISDFLFYPRCCYWPRFRVAVKNRPPRRKLQRRLHSRLRRRPRQPAAPAAAPATTPTSAPPPASAEAALATTDGESPGVKIAVTELKRTSGTITLKFTVFNGGDKEYAPCFDGDQWRRNHNLAAVHLIDGASKKKYFVVTDSEGACVCSNGISNTAPKSQTTLWAKFPAPPDDVQKIAVEIPHFVPMEDVPISR